MNHIVEFNKEEQELLLSFKPEEQRFIKVFMLYVKQSHDRKYMSIELSSKLDDLERIDSPQEKVKKFEERIKYRGDRYIYRAIKLIEIEEKYEMWEEAINSKNLSKKEHSKIDAWRLKLKV